MLAERRKKVIYSNPRGTLWANDKQKFGQKMLESMGWKEGDGLGKDNNGITENVKASFKFDNKGFGFKTKATDWIEDNNVYEQILSDLSKYHKVNGKDDGDQSEPTKEQFNIEQSTKSSNRLHYKKFIKAKNLSIKSKDDLYCIFPTKSKESVGVQNDEPEPEDSQKLVTSESKLSVQDYFQQKMKEKLKKSVAPSEIPADFAGVNKKGRKHKRQKHQ